MITEAEADGTLTPGKTLIEPSSGNTGIAMAMIAKLKGYPIKIVLPENVSIERRQLLEVWGAEIISSPGAEGSNGAVRKAQALADEHPDWAFLYQYANEANPRAHYETTGPEIWRDCPEITHFVAGLGTSGTLMGVGTYLKEQNPAIQVIAVEPPLGEKVEGLRNLDEGYIPPVYEKWGGPELLDRKRVVRPRESIEWTRRLGEVGIFSGISAGAAMAGAAKVAGEIDAGTIVFIVADYGWKYLSTGAWTDDIDEVVEPGREDHLLLIPSASSQADQPSAMARAVLERGGVAGHGGEERVAAHRQHDARLDRVHRRGAGGPVQQRDLAEAVAARQPDAPSAHRSRRGGDRSRRRSSPDPGFTAPDHHGAGRDLLAARLASQGLERRGGQRSQERRGPQRRHLGERDVGLAIHADEGRAEDRRRSAPSAPPMPAGAHRVPSAWTTNGTLAEPTASIAIWTASTSEKTCPRTSRPEIRCSSMRLVSS